VGSEFCRERVLYHATKAAFSCLSSTAHNSRFRDSRRPHHVQSLGVQQVTDPEKTLQLLFPGQKRSVSSWLPEVVQDFSIWGGTAHAIKALHMDGAVPYWACFALMNFGLRTALIPLVLYSAHTSSRFSKVAPELQFIVTLFQNDLKKIRAEGKGLYEQRLLFQQNMTTVRSVYKLHNINPLMVFLSPLMQIPFFYYVAIDLRKMVNGADPALAQELCESGFYWVTDLTAADPWYGLPIAAGAMLYLNVEIAIGRRALAGPTAGKSDFASLLKDAFQTLAVFMPCLASVSPAGLQIYLLSSFTFTLFQGAALRDDTCRGLIGLTPLGMAPTEPKFAKEFMEFKKLEQKARDIRGDGPVLGKNILAVGFETSFPGTNRPTTIEGSGQPPPDMTVEKSVLREKPSLSVEQAKSAWGGDFIHGISAPVYQLEEQLNDQLKEERIKEMATEAAKSDSESFQKMSDQAMEAANKGVVIPPRQESKVSKPVNPMRLKSKKRKGISKKGKSKR
jgi:membrane protein insertase Oxa1/YidC/SpoIIIJ